MKSGSLMLALGLVLSAHGCWNAPENHWDIETGRGKPFISYHFAALVMDVEVDTGTRTGFHISGVSPPPTLGEAGRGIERLAQGNLTGMKGMQGINQNELTKNSGTHRNRKAISGFGILRSLRASCELRPINGRIQHTRTDLPGLL